MPIPPRFKIKSAEIDRRFPKSLYMTMCRDALVRRVRHGNGRMSPMAEGFQDYHRIRSGPSSTLALAQWICRSVIENPPMFPDHVDCGLHIICQNDKLGRPAVVMGAKTHDVDP